MFEWLLGDPLIGMLTAISFCAFLLLGRSLKLRKMKKERT